MMLVLFVQPVMMLTTISQTTTQKKPQRLDWMKATVLIQKLVDHLC
jgi:hypothetical protein